MMEINSANYSDNEMEVKTKILQDIGLESEIKNEDEPEFETEIKNNDLMELKTEIKKEEIIKLETEIQIIDQSESVTKLDPFAYLDRDDFTSEKYKVEIRNLPKHYGFAVSKLKRLKIFGNAILLLKI